MKDWLSEVGDHTQSHREERARHFDEGARRVRAQRRLAGANEKQVEDDTQWHRSRARGQRIKIENVRACGTEQLRITCQSCGRSHDRPGRCGNSRLCLRCRGAFAAVKRALFILARLAVLEMARRRGLLDPRRPKGRFSEKFLTLTTPHLPTDTIASRIQRIAIAWQFFRKELKRYFNAKDAQTFEWFRVLEWTVGSDGLGHPHLHIWLFSSYVHWDLVRDLWRTALIKAGCTATDCAEVIVQIEEFKDGDGRGARELIKYLTKDIDANGEKVPAEVYAEVYKAFDGRRVTQASSGFMALAKGRAQQCECGASLPRRVRKVKPEAPTGSASDGVDQ